MPSELYWIEGALSPRLAIMARPRAGDWLEDEVAHWRRSGVGLVVSLLEGDEVRELGLERRESLCEANGIAFLSFPIPDREVPDAQCAKRFAQGIAQGDKAIAIHCRAGIGRASIMAAAILVNRGFAPDDALLAIERARRLPIPDTAAQRAWVMDLAASG